MKHFYEMILPEVLIVFPDEKAEVAMAVLPLLLQAKAGVCTHKHFLWNSFL